MKSAPNKITGPNAGGLRELQFRPQMAARVGQFGSLGGSTEIVGATTG